MPEEAPVTTATGRPPQLPTKAPSPFPAAALPLAPPPIPVSPPRLGPTSSAIAISPLFLLAMTGEGREFQHHPAKKPKKAALRVAKEGQIDGRRRGRYRRIGFLLALGKQGIFHHLQRSRTRGL